MISAPVIAKPWNSKQKQQREIFRMSGKRSQDQCYQAKFFGQ
jgi:hypothetical protein